MRAQIDFTMSQYGGHSPFLRLWPASDHDEAFILSQESTEDGLTGWLKLMMGLRLERRYLPRERRPMGQAYFEMFWTGTPAGALVGLSLWLPGATLVDVHHDGRALLPDYQGLYDALQEIVRRRDEQERVEAWCAGVLRRHDALTAGQLE